MSVLLFAISSAVVCAMPLADESPGTKTPEHLHRTLLKEPTYESTPKYSLLVLGGSGDSQPVWMVEDGRRLFLDRNANGDLTDDGAPIRPDKLQKLGKDRWDFKYLPAEITPADGSRHTDFVLRRWNYGEKEDSYGLSLSVGGEMPMYAGWSGTFWSESREKAPVIQFGGPFSLKVLRRKEFAVGETRERLSLCFLNPGSGPGAESRVSIAALPESVVPEVDIEWPTADEGAPLRTSHQLSKRCCYWEFYTTDFEVPDGVVVGTAKVTIRFPFGSTPIELKSTEVTVPVKAGRTWLDRITG